MVRVAINAEPAALLPVHQPGIVSRIATLMVPPTFDAEV